MVIIALTCLSAGCPRVNTAKQATVDPQQKLIEAARKYAEAGAGSNTSEDYFRLLDYALVGWANSQRGTLATGSQDDGEQEDIGPFFAQPPHTDDAPFPIDSKTDGDPHNHPLRSDSTSDADVTSIYESPLYQKNFREWLIVQPDSQSGRIIGGTPVKPGELIDCVAVGSSTSFRGSGTLIGPNVVLTAGHCVEEGLSKRVYFGNDWNTATPKDTVEVLKAITYKPYRGDPDYLNDIALLILKEKVDRKWCPLALTEQINGEGMLEIAGFGFTEVGILGKKSKTQIQVASLSCSLPTDPRGYGCHQGNEIVAGGNGHDSCKGDSGGPAYIQVNGRRLLAGVTSRKSLAARRMCADGGIYVRVDSYSKWIRDEAKKYGGVVPP